jgi:hypothetical protein
MFWWHLQAVRTVSTVDSHVRWRTDRIHFWLEDEIMNAGRMDEIRDEISSLLAKQRVIVNDPTIMQLSAEETDTYTKRNHRLRELCRKLID